MLRQKCGESILKNSGFNSLIASDKKNYIDKAIYLSQDLNKLNDLRKDIYSKILNTPLFNNKKFSDHFSKILRRLSDRIN